jgi:hypothetical protein
MARRASSSATARTPAARSWLRGPSRKGREGGGASRPDLLSGRRSHLSIPPFPYVAPTREEVVELQNISLIEHGLQTSKKLKTKTVQSGDGLAV